MASDIDHYRSALLKSKTDTRLLTLCKGSGDDPIQCSLATVDLEQNPRYEALSYCWGPPDNPGQIYLAKRTREVRENLWWALWHLRRGYEDRILWVDALCINQTNVAERNHQVGLMGRIYSQAFGVIVWLGGRADNSDLAMGCLKTIPFRLPTISSAEETSLRKLLGREYWKRMWILQEYGLASELTIWCGDKSVDWRAFEELIMKDRSYQEFSAAWVIDCRTARRTNDPPRQILIALVAAFLKRKCVDPRDTVYALLGIASDCKQGELKPDYSKSLFATYMSLMKLYLPPGPLFPVTIAGNPRNPAGVLAHVLQLYLRVCRTRAGFHVDLFGNWAETQFIDLNPLVPGQFEIPSHYAKFSLSSSGHFNDKWLERAIKWLEAPDKDAEDADSAEDEDYPRSFRTWPLYFPDNARQLSKLQLFIESYNEKGNIDIEISESNIKIPVKEVGVEIALDSESGLFTIKKTPPTTDIPSRTHATTPTRSTASSYASVAAQGATRSTSPQDWTIVETKPSRPNPQSKPARKTNPSTNSQGLNFR